MSGDQKLTNKRCKTCSTNIEAKSAIFHCVACVERMHLTKKYTGMSQDAINGISGIMQNVLLIRQKCLELKKKDKILDVIVSSRTDETIRELKQEVVEIKGEAKLIGNQLKENKSDIGIKSVQPSPAEPKPVDVPQTQRKILKKEYCDGIRFRGIPELVSTNSRDRYEHDFKEVKAVAKHLRVTCNVTDLKRLGKYQERKSRSLVAKIYSDYAKGLILLSLAKIKDYGKPVFISKKLNPSQQANKNEILQTRREMIKTGKNP